MARTLPRPWGFYAPVIAAATSDIILAPSAATGRIPLAVQQATGAGVDALTVYANGGLRLQVDTSGNLILTGGISFRYTAVTPASTPGTAIAAVRFTVAVADAAGASRHVQLPAANSLQAGQVVMVVDTPCTAATNNITINRAGSDTISTTTTGNTSVTITTNGGAIWFVSDGTSVWKCLRMTG
jgi:hypothetical protein